LTSLSIEDSRFSRRSAKREDPFGTAVHRPTCGEGCTVVSHQPSVSFTGRVVEHWGGAGQRVHTGLIAEYGGLLRVMPLFTIVFFIAVLSSMGMPGLNGFIGEITILRGAYQMSFNWAFWCVTGIALGAAYLIWLFQRTMLGETAPKNLGLKDLSAREIAVFAPLVICAFWIGLYPKPFFAVLERPAAQIVERVRSGAVPMAASAAAATNALAASGPAAR
jgi:NADH-quinone oxidoreductase subunit M